MAFNNDFTVATSRQIEIALCKRLEEIRLSRNMTQEHMAAEAGVSLRTVGRLEKGQGVSMDTFIRVLKALRIQQNLEALLPDLSVRPIERIGVRSAERRRARPARTKSPNTPENQTWQWGDGAEEREQ